jgi:hypothetical protein
MQQEQQEEDERKEFFCPATPYDIEALNLHRAFSRAR